MKAIYTVLLCLFPLIFLSAQEIEYHRIINNSSEFYPWKMIQIDNGHTIIHGVDQTGDLLFRVDEEYNVIWSKLTQTSNQVFWDLQTKNIIEASDSSFYFVTGFNSIDIETGLTIHEITFEGEIINSETYLFDKEVFVKFVHLNDAGRLAFTVNYNSTVLYCQKDSDNNLNFVQLSNENAPLEINTIKTISDSLTILLGSNDVEQNGSPIAIAINDEGLLEWSMVYQNKDNQTLWKAFDIFLGDSIHYMTTSNVSSETNHSQIDINTGEIISNIRLYTSQVDLSGPISSRYIVSNSGNIYLKSASNIFQIGPENKIINLDNEIGIHAFNMLDSVSFHYAGSLVKIPAKSNSFSNDIGIKKGQNLFELFSSNYNGFCEWMVNESATVTEITSNNFDIILNYGTLVPADNTFTFEDIPLSAELGCVSTPDNTEDIEIEYSIEISPNPSMGIFNIILDNETLKTVEVYNELGAKIQGYQYENGTTNIQLDLSDYTPGIYFIRMDMEYSSAMKKVVVVR